MIRMISSLMLLAPMLCLAGPFEYVCAINQEFVVNKDGDLRQYKKPIAVGNSFAIDRRTGRVVGRPFTNTTASKVEIITRGDHARHFEVLSASSPIGKATTDLIVVEEWQKGPNKPFVGLSAGTVYSGVCK